MPKKSQENLIKLIEILSDGEYHDGTSIGEKLSLTRSAVWKLIKKLLAYQIKIDSIKGKGYALQEPLILLNFSSIKKMLNNKVSMEIFETIPSTNDFLKSQKNHKHPNICLSEMQTAGKGRFNRSWYAPFAQNLYFSCRYHFQKDISELAGLSLVTSLAVIKTLQDYEIKDSLFVKWSNDVVYDGKKISGNLIEVQAETHDACQAIIGIGINVNMLQAKGKDISQPWVSMRKILGHYVDRNQLTAILTNHLLDYLQQFTLHGFTTFVNEWNKWDCLINKTIVLKKMDQIILGRMVGVNEQGQLKLELPNGDIQAFSSGETSIVKR